MIIIDIKLLNSKTELVNNKEQRKLQAGQELSCLATASLKNPQPLLKLVLQECVCVVRYGGINTSYTCHCWTHAPKVGVQTVDICRESVACIYVSGGVANVIQL